MAKTTSVLSARVNSEVLSHLDLLASKEGKNRSQMLTSLICLQQGNTLKLTDGGKLKVRTIPKEVEDMLVAGGVAVVGIGAYNLVYNMLDNAVDNEFGGKKFTKNECQFISVMVGVAIAMGGFGVYKALTK
jgi:hypothetical protein